MNANPFRKHIVGTLGEPGESGFWPSHLLLAYLMTVMHMTALALRRAHRGVLSFVWTTKRHGYAIESPRRVLS